MEEVIVKCKKCGSESLGDSRFCSFCGNKLQPEKLRTIEEIKEMQKKIPKSMRIENGQDILKSLVIGLTIHRTLEWVMGMVTDEGLSRLLKGEKNER
ncbi:hypothetical protein ES703_38833 [subsurface metagenome]